MDGAPSERRAPIRLNLCNQLAGPGLLQNPNVPYPLLASLDRAMRYYFDLEADGTSTEDQEGTECGNFDEMRGLAMSFLVEVAHDEKGKKNERMLRTIVRDGSGTGVYEAILTLTGRPL